MCPPTTTSYFPHVLWTSLMQMLLEYLLARVRNEYLCPSLCHSLPVRSLLCLGVTGRRERGRRWRVAGVPDFPILAGVVWDRTHLSLCCQSRIVCKVLNNCKENTGAQDRPFNTADNTLRGQPHVSCKITHHFGQRARPWSSITLNSSLW